MLWFGLVLGWNIGASVEMMRFLVEQPRTSAMAHPVSKFLVLAVCNLGTLVEMLKVSAGLWLGVAKNLRDFTTVPRFQLLAQTISPNFASSY